MCTYSCNFFLELQLFLFQLCNFDITGRRAALQVFDVFREVLVFLLQLLQVRTQAHYNPPEDIHDHYDGHAFWSFVELSQWVNEDYGGRISKLRKNKIRIENKLLKKQDKIESTALKLYDQDPEKANEMLSNMTNILATISWKKSNKLRK